MIVNAPISVGELIDKITILRIKSEQITDSAKLKNIAQELELLTELKTNLNINSDNIDTLEQQLYEVNQELWVIEDTKRQCEREQNFGPGFVYVARQVYLKNDLRAAIKRGINQLSGSNIVEEKSYK
jgi:hypothetical protein